MGCKDCIYYNRLKSTYGHLWECTHKDFPLYYDEDDGDDGDYYYKEDKVRPTLTRECIFHTRTENLVIKFDKVNNSELSKVFD